MKRIDLDLDSTSFFACFTVTSLRAFSSPMPPSLQEVHSEKDKRERNVDEGDSRVKQR